MVIIVCLKPVPDPKHWHKLKLDQETKTLVRRDIPAVINPLDKNALEEAIRLRDIHGGEVVVLSMAPPDSQSVIRTALAMGADRGVLLADPFFAGSDTLGTSHVLAEGIRSIGGFDLVLCGNETIDGGTAQVSAQLAEFLDIPNIMQISRINFEPGGGFQVRSQMERGYRIIEVRPPVVLSVIKDLNEPRYVTMMNILEAESKEINLKCINDLNLCELCVGLINSPTQMADLFIPESGGAVEMLSGDVESMAGTLADRLYRLGFC